MVGGCHSEQRPGRSEGVSNARIRGRSFPDRGKSRRRGPERAQTFAVLQEQLARKPVGLESSEQGQVVGNEAREVGRAGASWGPLWRGKKETLSYSQFKRVTVFSSAENRLWGEACEKPERLVGRDHSIQARDNNCMN